MRCTVTSAMFIMFASSCSNSPRVVRVGSPLAEPSVATRDELRLCADSLYTCLEGRWQTFVHHRGGTVSVFIDRAPWGNVTVLRDIRATDVQEVRLLTSMEAATAYGTKAGGAVLEVTLRRASP